MSNKEKKIEKQNAVELVPTEKIEQGYVVLPYNEGEFKDFIKSLLGSPQTITKNFQGIYALELNDVFNLHQLIYQRITQQNEGILAQFSAKIVFSDDSSVGLNSLEDLMSYNEIRPIVSRAIHLTWDFVVRFQDKKVPEKQRIQVSFIASGESRESIDDDLGIERISPALSRIRFGIISFRIEHTARTWGADIEALLSNHIKSIMKAPSKAKMFFRRYAETIGLWLAIIFIVSTVWVAWITAQSFGKKQQESIQSALNGDTVTLESINSKMDIIATMVASGDWQKFGMSLIFFIIVALILAVIFGAVVASAISKPEPSFILLTKLSYIDQDTQLNSLKREWLWFFLSIAIDLIVNIGGGLLFLRFFGK